MADDNLSATSVGGKGMTDEQRYLFDLQGFLVVKRALDQATISELLSFWNRHLTGKSLHDVSFDWGPAWRSLIDQQTTFPIIQEMMGGRVKLDHCFAVDQRFGNRQRRMHHHADMFDAGIFYRASKGRMFNGLVGVIYTLIERDAESPCFCAIPGSHKGAFDTPIDYYTIPTCPLAKTVYAEPGDAIIFNEAITHGTWLPDLGRDKRGPRRAIMVKYTPDCMAYREPKDWPLMTATAPTPNYPHDAAEGQFDTRHLTQRQQRLVSIPAFHRNRPVAS